MDLKALLALSALCCKRGNTDLAVQILKEAAQCPDFDDFYTSCVQNQLPVAAIPAPACNEPVAVAEDVTPEGGTLDGLDNLNNHVDPIPPYSPQMPGGNPSDNTLNPSLHGDGGMSFGSVIAIACAIHAQKQFVHDGDEFDVDPQLLATASSEIEHYDEDALVSKVRNALSANSTLKPGRIKIAM